MAFTNITFSTGKVNFYKDYFQILFIHLFKT